MKKALLFLACTFMMVASISLKAQEVTFLLRPGWNWIGYPYPESVDLENAFGDFEPMTDDVIESFWGYSEYVAGYGWFGGIDELKPGWGYMYYSNRTEAVIVELSAPASQTAVTTAEPTSITAESAVVGGTVTVPEGAHVFLRGVCWGTEPNPDIDGGHTDEGTGIGSFSSTLEGLNPNTTYYVRTYAVTDHGLAYGNELSFTTLSGIPVVTTAEVTDVTGNSAQCGGTVTDGGGLEITARGVCWSTSHNPTLSDSHTTDGTGTGSFTSSLTVLSASTTYYVRAYATNSLVTIYGSEQSFTTEAGGGSGGDHAYVDLGLPSGLLWATCNVGADNPEDYGDYFAWGETQPKDTYDWSTYQYANGTSWQDPQFTKYCNKSNYGYNGFTDNLTTLLAEDDAATANWGSDWRMPTKEEWQELYNNTTVTWTTQNGVYGRLFTASNGNSLFLPAAGYRFSSILNGDGSYGYYWSSSLYTDTPYHAWLFYFRSDNFYKYRYYRSYGQSVRPVRSISQNNAPTGAIDGKFTINADGDQVYFSQGNLQYIGSASTPYWKFADNQWDVLGTTTGQNSNNQNVDRDLFGWGTSGYNHGANCYQPWSTSTSYSDYYAYGSYNYNLYDQTGQADWGYNAISNGGNQANQWRTLTYPEWAYIFYTRTTSSGIRYAKAKVNDMNGVILLPDDWSSDTYSLSDTNSSGANFSSNTITASQWSALEQAGAIFLPAAGDRGGTSVHGMGSFGYYWSASYGDSSNVYFVNFYGSGLYTGHYGNSRYWGESVRLVVPAEN